MILELVFSVAAICCLLAASAFFSGSETALTAVSKARMFHLANEGSRRAASVNALIGNRERLIGSMLLGNTFVNILTSSIATETLLPYFPESGVVITTGVLTVLVLIFAEVLPKTIAIVRTDQMALAVAWPARIAVMLLSPVVATVQFVVWRILWLCGLRHEEAESSVTAQEEIRGAIELHHEEGTVEREHRDMLGGILDLTELRIADVMVHRKNMDVLDADSSPQEIVEQVLASKHTRIPITKDGVENIVGVLHAKDLIRELMQRRGKLDGLDIASLLTPPWFVPDTTTLEEQLAAFRERGEHIALVVDEYGGLQGLVTLEDILEEIFGNIAEETSHTTPEGIRPQADGSYNVDGWVPIRDLNRELEWDLPDEEATTVAGLVIHEAHIIPEPGQRFSFFGYKFEILRKQRNQITALRITPPRQDVEAAS